MKASELMAAFVKDCLADMELYIQERSITKSIDRHQSRIYLFRSNIAKLELNELIQLRTMTNSGHLRILINREISSRNESNGH